MEQILLKWCLRSPTLLEVLMYNYSSEVCSGQVSIYNFFFSARRAVNFDESINEIFKVFKISLRAQDHCMKMRDRKKQFLVTHVKQVGNMPQNLFTAAWSFKMVGGKNPFCSVLFLYEGNPHVSQFRAFFLFFFSKPIHHTL